MSRCNKCDGCTSMWETTYRPDYCNDPECPEGIEKPGKAEREAELQKRRDEIREQLKETP